jgi:hypothetical protein
MVPDPRTPSGAVDGGVVGRGGGAAARGAQGVCGRCKNPFSYGPLPLSIHNSCMQHRVTWCAYSAAVGDVWLGPWLALDVNNALA